MRESRKTAILAALAFSAAALALAGAAHASSGSDNKSDVRLVSTGVAADAAGRARLRVRSASDGRFDLRVSGLAPSSTFQVLIDSVPVADMTTDDQGEGRIRLRSQPRSPSDGLLGTDPRGTVLLVRDAAGNDVLAGELPAGGNASDATEIVCCVPDDSGTECEDRTADECGAEGGTVSTATTCLPNPCDTSTPPTDDHVVCCTPDDSATECEDRTVEECSADGGVVVQADSCDSNPCAAVPPAEGETRCCEADDSGNQCESRLPSECLARGGVDIGAGTCSADACAGVPVPTGAESIRVRCEQRSSRSRAEVEGTGLRDGSYTATVDSGANEVTTAPLAAQSGQATFEFSSDSGDIAGGATAIDLGFLSGSPASITAKILDSSGNVIVQGTATCTN
ncbi:MAG TPA: hypothetical protein VGK20_15820 [Candidatus Binatia bacterium]|jgi:hypothetical protein